MTPEQHLDHVAADSTRFAELAADSLDDQLEALGWTARELLAHLGAVYVYAATNATNPGPQGAQLGDEVRAPQGDAVNQWFADRRATLLETLEGLDDEAVVWTHAGMKPAKWWKRRMASETAVHRWDMDAGLNGIASAQPIDGDLATDGVDEYIEVGLRFSADRPDRRYPPESLHLHRTDGPGEWMVVGDGAGGVTMTHEHGKGDAAVRGSASDLLLWMWGRAGGDLQIFGDEAVATTWHTLSP